MRRAALIAAFALALPPAAAAQEADPPPPVPDEVRVVVVFNPITFGEPTYVNGVLRGVAQAGEKVSLEEAPFPFGTWTEVDTTTTDQGGYFSFRRRPSFATRWRVISRTSNSGISPEVQGDVAPRLRFGASLRGRTVSYTGSLAPAHDGLAVEIQRKSRRGGWSRLTTARLRRTAFRGRLRIRGRTVLRAFFLADGDHLQAATAPVTLDPR